MKRPLLLALSLLVPLSAAAKEVTIASVSANSEEKDSQTGTIYKAEHVLTDKTAEYWIEGEEGSGSGKYLQVDFDGTAEVHSMTIWPGCFIDETEWKRHNRLKDIEIKFSDFKSEKFTLKDSFEPQTITFEAPHATKYAKIYLRSFHSGSAYMASGMTKVQFFDASGPDDQPLKAKKVSESSKLENSKAFAGAMAADGWLDTWWAEGADGDGSGEWLKFDFDGTKKLSRGAISMGLDQTESFFKGNNRATKATLTFSDGSTKDITLQDAMGLQEFDLGGVSTSSVQVTFGGIVKGETANDLYVGEVRFWE